MGTNTIPRLEESNPAAADAKIILDSIRMIVRALRVSSRQCESDTSLSGAQIFILRQLSGKSSLSINDIAARTFTHQSTVSGLVSRLVEGDYIVSAPAREDGRRLELSLTPKGIRKLKSAPKTAQEEMARAIRDMSPAHRRSLASLMHKLVQDAGLSKANPPLFFED